LVVGSIPTRLADHRRRRPRQGHRVNHPSDDDRNQPPDEPAPGRRSVWSHRVALGVLVVFAAFVIFNAVTVLAMIYANAAHGSGGPFGN
jgi:hypothetical protein